MNEPLVGLIPAAGRGMRLGLPYPKELYPIIRDNRYKPVSQFVLENLVAAGTQHVVIVINETKHQLIGYYGDGSRFGCRISYVVQEHHALGKRSTSPGLAHALDAAHHLVQGQTVLFGMADTIMTPLAVFRHMLDRAEEFDDVLLGLYHTQTPEKFGMVDFAGPGRVRGIVDKPPHTELRYMWGCMAWNSRFTEHLHACVNEHHMADFARVMNDGIEAGLQFRGVCIEGTYADLGTYEEIMALEEQFRAPSEGRP